jgi:hypothetical protein
MGQGALTRLKVKASARVRESDLHALREFTKDYPEADLLFVYGGLQKRTQGDITFVPAEEFLRNLQDWI